MSSLRDIFWRFVARWVCDGWIQAQRDLRNDIGWWGYHRMYW